MAGRWRRGAFVAVCLVATALGTGVAAGSSWPAAFTEAPLLDFAAASERLSVNGAVRRQVVKDPVAGQADVLEVTYPAFREGGDAWPALKIPAGVLSTADWSGADAALLRVYNPYEEAVDIGFFLRAGEQRHGPHRLLQPQVWNTIAWRLDDLGETLALGSLSEVHVFMTRPKRDLTLYLGSLALVREADWSARPLPQPLVLADFEDASALSRWQAHGVTARLTDRARLEGAAALELQFVAHQAGRPRRPAFQARYFEGALPARDGSSYADLCLDLRNPGRHPATLALALHDQSGAKAERDLVIPGRGRLAARVSLADLGLDCRRIVQLDLAMAEPAQDHTLWIDAIRLEGRRSEEAQRLMARLEASLAQAGRVQPGGVLPEQYRQTLETVRAVWRGFDAEPTFGGAQFLLEAAAAAGRQADRLDRDLHAARLLAETRRRVPGARFGVGIADSMEKVPIHEQPLQAVGSAERVTLELARNEWESFQVVVLGAEEALSEVRVEPGDFRHDDGATLPAGAFTSSLVGHVLTRQPPYPVPYVGWWPDPILDFQTAAPVAPGEAVSFWIRIHMPPEAAPGRYRGRVTVRAAAGPAVEVPVTLRVFDLVLPDLSFLPTACSFYDTIRQLWGKDMSAEEYQRRFDAAADVLARYKIDLDHIYRRPKDDPAALALPVASLRRLKDRGLLQRFMIFHVDTPREVTAVDHPSVQQSIDRCLRNLDYWVPRLREEGLLEHAYLYGYDEVPAKAFPVLGRVFGAIKAAYPEMPLMTTAYDHSFGLDTGLAGKVDWWVPLTPRFDPERVARARERGMEVWWYICIGPKHPYCNWLIEYPAIEARLLMGAMTAKYCPDGFLYYALTRWPRNLAPITQGPLTDWDPRSYGENNGDGSLFCAGPDGLLATIRAENFRDGMEDHDYVVILRRLIAQAEGRPRQGWVLRRALREARAAVEVPADVVVDLKTYSRDPARLRAMRRRVAEAIEGLEKALR